MSGGGLKFKGLRYFFADKPIKGHKRSVTVYLSDASNLTSLTLTVKNGDVTLKNIWNENVVYNVNVIEGDLSFNEVVTTAVIAERATIRLIAVGGAIGPAIASAEAPA